MDSIQYERISDDVCFLGNNALLKFNVQLARKDKNTQRSHYHTEYIYDSDKYTNSGDLISLKRQFSYYLSIEIFKYEGKTKPWIQITANDMIILRMILNECIKWYLDSKYKNLFAYNKTKELSIFMRDIKPLSIETFGHVKLSFIPCVVEEFGKKVEGIRFTLGDPTAFVDMSTHSFMGFKYHIDNFNMFQSAQLMINYIEKPTAIKRIYVNPDMSGNNITDISTRVNTRVPKGEQKEMSLSDKLGGL